MAEMVKCADCGLLAVLRKQTGEYAAADKLFRDTGEIPNFDGNYVYNPYPFCAAKLRDFHELIGRQNPDNDGSIRCKTFHEPIPCDGFTDWNPCFSPKEHKEMILSEKMLEIQRKREDDDREWRDAQARKDQKWREDQDRIATRRHRQDLVWIGILVPLVTAATMVVSAFIQRGDLFKASSSATPQAAAATSSK